MDRHKVIVLKFVVKIYSHYTMPKLALDKRNGVTPPLAKTWSVSHRAAKCVEHLLAVLRRVAHGEIVTLCPKLGAEAAGEGSTRHRSIVNDEMF